MAHTMGVRRGCGVRAAGGIYFETGLSITGKPIEYFLVDPPVPVDLRAMDISEVGVHLREYQGRPVVFDVVGQEHYPNVADFIEETRRFGISRRAPVNFDFAALEPGTRLVLIHQKAVIQNALDYYRERLIVWECPKRFPEHHYQQVHAWLDTFEQDLPMGGAQQQMMDLLTAEARFMDAMLNESNDFPVGLKTCAGLWWQDLPPMDPDDARPVSTLVEMPSFVYPATRRPATIVPRYQHGIFGVFPISNISVIHTQDQQRLKKAVDAVRGAALSWSLDLE